MSSSLVCRIAGYVPSGSGHWAAKLEPTTEDALRSSHEHGSTTLWSTTDDEGKEGLERALLHPANEPLLCLLGEQPAARVGWRMRELGMTADVDVLALLETPDGGQRTLLLIACEPVGATKPSRIRAQYARLLRSCRTVLGNLSIAAPQPVVVAVLLAAWRPEIELPEVETRPGWGGVALPRPAVWGYVPFRAEGEEHVVFGRWSFLDAHRRARRIEQRNRGWFDTELKSQPPAKRALRRIDFRVDLGEGSGLCFLLDRGPFRARLRVGAPKHRRALLAETREDYQVRRIRSLRTAAYQRNWAPTGWRFLGETVEQGTPWLTWQWAAPDAPVRIDWVTATSEAERFVITLKMYIAGA